MASTLSALEDLNSRHDVVLMAEVDDECTYVKHHAKKIVLVLSAMRHFAARLRELSPTSDPATRTQAGPEYAGMAGTEN